MTDYLRTSAMSVKYKEYRANGGLTSECVLCGAPALKQFTYWKTIKNEFPYDRIAAAHDMLLPLRHTDGVDFTAEELAELVAIKATHGQEYDYIIEATLRNKSIPQHFHLHLIEAKMIE